MASNPSGSHGDGPGDSGKHSSASKPSGYIFLLFISHLDQQYFRSGLRNEARPIVTLGSLRGTAKVGGRGHSHDKDDSDDDDDDDDDDEDNEQRENWFAGGERR